MTSNGESNGTSSNGEQQNIVFPLPPPRIPLTMEAVTWHGQPYHMTVGGVARVTIEHPDDVLVRLTTSAICGSDIHTYHGLLGGDNIPYVMGHEGIGHITQTGANVKSFKVGDRVVIPDTISKPKPDTYGFGTLEGEYIGGMQAEYVRVPNADSQCLHLPAGKDHEHDFIMLSDIFPTAWGSLTKSGFQQGDSVAVFGAGPVGLLCAYSAILRGASRVYSIDHVESRLQKAKSIGAIPIDLRKGDPAEQILKLEPEGVRRACDCVGFECVNSELKRQEGYVVNQIVKVVGTGGGAYITGVYWAAKATPGEPKESIALGHISFPIADWWVKGITIAGGPVLPQQYWEELKELIVSGKAKPSVVVDRIIPISEAVQAYADFSARRVGKVLIEFSGPATDE